MRVNQLHDWNLPPREAIQLQHQLRPLVKTRGMLRKVRYVAGVDISIRNKRAIAAVPVLRFSDLELVDLVIVDQPVPYPYVPGLLSFRECPAILEAMEKLRVEPDLLMVDGQGFAHPRRLGIASHLGVVLDKPTIGCAKTRFVGEHDEPALEAGYYTDLFDKGELIGAVLRTRTGVKPLYISVGHKISLPRALDLVLQCSTGFRLPEPIRRAHQEAGRHLAG